MDSQEDMNSAENRLEEAQDIVQERKTLFNDRIRFWPNGCNHRGSGY